jgi:Zinc dependent phospholipase C
MPSFGIHIIVMDEVHERLKQSKSLQDNKLADLISNNPEMKTLGAIGPDLFYYLDFEKKIISSLGNIYSDVNKIPAFLSDAGSLANDFGLPNFGNLVKQLAETAQIVLGTLEGSLTASLISLNDLISGSPSFPISQIQKEEPETKWNWGDLLHDRRSGIFARMINQKSSQTNNQSWLSYSLGYKSHLMTDLVGHPYVNQVVGGPARGWNMRHTIAEKFMDAKAFYRRNRDINISKIDSRMRSLNNTDLKNLTRMLEEQLKSLIVSSSGMPYSLPKAPEADDIEDAYNSMVDIFGYITNDLYVHPPTRPNIVIPPLPGQYGSITNAIGSLRPPSGGHLSLADILKLLLYALLLLPSILADIAKAAADILLGVITYPMRALLYLLESFLYKIYRSIRWYLVLAGVAFPCLDELNSDLGRQFITCPNPDERYPRHPKIISTWTERLNALNRILEFKATDEIYLYYPSMQPPEFPTHLSSVYPSGIDPEYFINQLQIDQTFFKNWKSITKPDDLKNIVHWPSQPPAKKGGFGNAVDLTLFYNQNESFFDNINLDSDRGYGFNQWACDGGIINGTIITERFL